MWVAENRATRKPNTDVNDHVISVAVPFRPLCAHALPCILDRVQIYPDWWTVELENDNVDGKHFIRFRGENALFKFFFY